MTSVKVKQPIGEWSAPHCVADEFTPGELTITLLETQDTLHVFKPHQWIEAVMYDSAGYPIAAYVNPFAEQAIARGRAMLRRAG